MAKDIKNTALAKNEMYMGNPNLPSKDARFEYTPHMIKEIEKSKNNMLHFAQGYFYIVDPDKGKTQIELYPFQRRVLRGVRDNRFNIILSPRQASKALALDTPIPTPIGWTTMGELKDGDIIYGMNGNPCNVVMAHDYRYDRPCYEIEFDNGEIIIADEDHNWFTQTKNDRDLVIPSKGSVKTTKQLLEKVTTKSGEPFHRIPSCINGLKNSEKELPIPPYILGLWLGDGSKDSSRITVGTQYIEELSSELSKYDDYKLIGDISYKPIIIVYYAFLNNDRDWKAIVLGQINDIYNSKILSVVYKFHLVVLGDKNALNSANISVTALRLFDYELDINDMKRDRDNTWLMKYFNAV